MTSYTFPVRLIICVDGTWCKLDGANTQDSPTSVYRIYASVKRGLYKDTISGQVFRHVKKYYNGIESVERPHSVDRWVAGASRNGYLEQIKEVYEDCCQLQDENDEVWLFGFSRGAYVVRAVAGLLNSAAALSSAGDRPRFDKEYADMLEVYRNMRSKQKPALSYSTRRAPRIKFVGVFDTVTAVKDTSLFDISFNPSITHMRHALALHEDRKALLPEYVFPESRDIQNRLAPSRSCIQAWFVGAHIDIGGSGSKAGLALFPLQWMLLECRDCGLHLAFDGFFEERATLENPLALVRVQANGRGATSDEWCYNTNNGIAVKMVDIRDVTREEQYKGRYSMKIRRNRNLPWPRRIRKPFEYDGESEDVFLTGYCEFAAQGTIVHPSVYLVLDEYERLYEETVYMRLLRPLELWRKHALGHYPRLPQLMNQGFWHNHEVDELDEPGAIRVLVCGNNGVGKSTLIDRIFGVDSVGTDATHSSVRSKTFGTVRNEITFIGRSDLAVHDSGGFEAGGFEEIEAIEDFLREKTKETDVNKRVHVIWFCIEATTDLSTHTQTAAEKLFRAVSLFASDVPVIVVVTKTDKLQSMAWDEHSQRMAETGEALSALNVKECDRSATNAVQEAMDAIEEEMFEIGEDTINACVGVGMRDKGNSIKALHDRTFDCLTNEWTRLLYTRAQILRIDLKIERGIHELMKTYKTVLHTAACGGPMPGWSSTDRLAGAIEVCKTIQQCFGLPDVSVEKAMDIYKATLGSKCVVAVAEGIALLGLFGSRAPFGMPDFLASGAADVALVVPATARMLLRMAADLILILIRSFHEASLKHIGQPQRTELSSAARAYRTIAPEVHQEINQLVPRKDISASFRSNVIRLCFEEIIRKYKPKVMQEIEALPAHPYRSPRATPESSFSDIDADTTYLDDDLKDIRYAAAGVDDVAGR